MRLSGLASFLIVLASALGSLSCVTEEIPGASEGSHRFEGILLENTCGATAVPAQELIEMDVQLRRDSTLAVWRPQSSPMLLGTISDAGDWRIRIASTVGITGADPLTGAPGCSLDQVETIQFAADPESDAPRYVGTTRVQFVPTLGSNCANTLAIVGGPFAELPCELEYELTSEPIDEIFDEPVDDSGDANDGSSS